MGSGGWCGNNNGEQRACVPCARLFPKVIVCTKRGGAEKFLGGVYVRFCIWQYVCKYQLNIEFEAIPKKLQDGSFITGLITVVLRGGATNQNNSSSSAFQFLAISQYPFNLSPNNSFASLSVGQLFALKLLYARSLSMPSQTR